MAESNFRGKFLIRIRKDGTILLPRDLKWEPGQMLEVDEYGFAGKLFLLHISNSILVNKAKAEIEAGQKGDG